MNLKKFKIFESPDEIEGLGLNWKNFDARYFGYQKGEFLFGEGVHHNRWSQKYPGRVWIKHKIISFWEYPETIAKLKKIITDIEFRIKENIWNQGWKIDVMENLIPLEEYKGIKDKRSEEEMKQQHLLSPMDKSEEKPKGWKPKHIKYRLPGESEIEAKRRLKYMYQENMTTNFDEFYVIKESVDFSKTKDWLSEQIMNKKGYVRQKRMKDKYIGYLQKLEDFSEDNQIIEKKELTQIKNIFDKLCAAYYNEDLRQAKEELLDKLGIPSYKYEGPFRFLHFYSLIDTKRLQEKINGSVLKLEEQEIVDKYLLDLYYWIELHDRIEFVRQVLNPTKEEREKKKLQQIKGKVNPKIREAIDNIAERFRKVIEKNEYEGFKRSIEQYKEKYGDSMTYDDMRKDKWTPRIIMMVYKKKMENNVPVGDYKLIENWKDFIEKEAIDYSHQVIQSFQYKMYDKIGGMISEINKPFKVEVTGRGMRSNNITFDFNDGSRFSIKNKIVSNVNQQGTFYYTYPTTFHDAYLPNNEKIPNPNEYTVKKAFNDYYIEIQKYNL